MSGWVQVALIVQWIFFQSFIQLAWCRPFMLLHKKDNGSYDKQGEKTGGHLFQICYLPFVFFFLFSQTANLGSTFTFSSTKYYNLYIVCTLRQFSFTFQSLRYIRYINCIPIVLQHISIEISHLYYNRSSTMDISTSLSLFLKSSLQP